MKVVSKFALYLSAASLVCAPAVYAQKAPKANAKAEQGKAALTKQLKFSKGFIKAYAPAVDALNKKKDYAAAQALWPSVKAAVAGEDDKSEAGVYGFALGRQLKNNALMLEGLDLVIASTSTSAQLRPVYMFQRGAIHFDAQDHAKAVVGMQEAYNAGYREGEIERLIAFSFNKTNKSAESLSWYRKFIDAQRAAGKVAEPSIYGTAANMALKANDNATANSILRDLIRTHSTKGAWYDALNVFNRTTDLEALEQLDLLRLMRLTGAMKFETDYALYAELVDKRRYPTEAMTVINEGLSAGIISKTNRSMAENLTDAQLLAKQDAANAALSEADAKKTANPYDALLTGDAYFALANYAKAESMYRTALAKGIIANREGKDQLARAQLHLGMALAHKGDYAAAKSEFAKVPAGNRQKIAEYWSIFMDQKLAPPKPAVAAATPKT